MNPAVPATKCLDKNCPPMNVNKLYPIAQRCIQHFLGDEQKAARLQARFGSSGLFSNSLDCPSAPALSLR